MQVLHLSADYPDPLAPAKTTAIRRLLELVPEIDHRVYSLNRVAATHGIHALTFDGHHRAVTYGAPPFGLLHRTFLHRVADWIMADIDERGLAPVAVHAHKLSIEALIGDKIARSLDVPLIVSCQGNSDLKILGAKPELRSAWREIWHGADWVLPFAPWTADALTELLGERRGPLTMLPCPTEADEILKPRIVEPVIRTAFNLDHHANKNARTITQATILAAEKLDGLRLEIIGTGSPSAFAQVQRMTQHSNVRLVGAIPNHQIQKTLNETACFLMPSLRESYGMVFAEALLAGCPVIHGAGNAIGGYFPGSSFAQPARSNSVRDLASQLIVMVNAQSKVKTDLALAQKHGALDILRRPAIAQRLRESLYTVTEISPPKPNAFESKTKFVSAK